MVYFMTTIILIMVYYCGCLEEDRSHLARSYCNKMNPDKFNSYLWAIDRPRLPTVYMFGTIHAPKDLVWDTLPLNVKDTFEASSHIYTEVNLYDAKIVKAIHECRRLPKDVTIKDQLPKLLFEKLERMIRRFERKRKRWLRKVPRDLIRGYASKIQQTSIYEQYKYMKPSWLMTTIIQQWNRYYVRSQAMRRVTLDNYLVRNAITRGSYKGGIEEISAHCDPINNLSTEHVNFALNVTLHAEDLKFKGILRTKENDIRYLTNLYKCGDPSLDRATLVANFQSLVDEDGRRMLQAIDRYLYHGLVVKRNEQIAERIENMLNDKRMDDSKMFFAVGAAHLLGNDTSVVAHLRGKGFTIRHIQHAQILPATMERIKQEEEARKLWELEYEKSRWQTEKKEKVPQVVIINTEVKKTYVYYYNRACALTSYLWLYLPLLTIFSFVVT